MNIKTAAKLTPIGAVSEGGGACVEGVVSVPVPEGPGGAGEVPGPPPAEGAGAEPPELLPTTLTVNFWPAAQ